MNYVKSNTDVRTKAIPRNILLFKKNNINRDNIIEVE